ncbi:MAG: DUF262 domain-containing protein [Candidatus Abyssobacteria bacterium SURF_17]|uniref:DUF262 domain-containing protein n=1 Tax=Candidatus Abyssobacteria bacterium SURF_17 TaxID=2093361 RepID=A0A419F370_9BACT|nr:MAG: DUF262 domain-containing protein [Candidatus Abyssubacteria bacterium SURF_17]
MPRQKVPDIEFNHFVLGQINDLFAQEKIYINPAYQRGDIWKHSQKIELIRSIESGYSIGVLVLFLNDLGKYEILDGQQRLLAIKKYLDGTLDLTETEFTAYQDLERRERIHTDAYCIYYLKLKSHDTESREEDIVQTFLRLQEGTPLNKAEKISAHRGAFKDAFKEAGDASELFKRMSGDKRFRLRLLAAEMLLLELEGDFENKIFPSLELQSFISAIKTYKKRVPPSKLRFYMANLDLLHISLNYLLTALKPSEALALYLLVSYLRKHKAGNQNLPNEISAFAKEFLKKLNSFSIYDKEAPKGMPGEIFQKYRAYKFAAKVMTTPESLKSRFEMILGEFARLKPHIEKDPKRYHDEEQKRELFFRQEGLCAHCGKPMDFRKSTADHVVSHGEGGKTDDLSNAQLLHERCHQKLEKSRRKQRKKEIAAGNLTRAGKAP